MTSTGELAIAIRGLSKRYRISHAARGRRTFGETVMNRLRNPLGRGNSTSDFYALKDVSLDVRKGDIVGIIGRNGAGKSTLLKVLSRITEPTAGNIKLYGRIGSLLEVGTGFHPELTGRENIFLNGAILGMSRPEIRRQFDAIVDFAEVEAFLDTPVKRYSSGMYVRLAFAVAAHLNPEILIVDEVLAVGDAEFQKKCLGKMGEVSRGGRTVLFVSHNMQAVRQLCTHGVLLHQGRTLQIGEIEHVVDAYLHSDSFGDSQKWELIGLPQHQLSICGVRAALRDQQPNHSLEIEVTLKSTKPHKSAFIEVDIGDALGTTIMQALPTETPFLASSPAQICRVTIALPPLVPGHYTAGVWVGSHHTETFDCVKHVVTFEVLRSPTKGRTVPHTPDHGFLVPHSRAEVIAADEGMLLDVPAR